MIARASILSLTALFASTSSFANEAITERLLEELGVSPTEQQIQSVYQVNSAEVLEVLSLLLKDPTVDPQVAITEALTIAPEKTEEIAQIAREAGVSNEIITTAALLAGLDPTQVAEATAAGIETASTAALATASAIAPPSVLAVGSNGGGGEGVVSPN
ncbi:hypothetical protein [Vibrio atypicus]|uniref:hypothetical protein n=1 Tax=Vibrio atypicus TaxID=558271 RepID=UPI003735D322